MSRPLNKMANKWLTHVKKTMKAHKGKKFSEVLKMAKKTYKGGADVQPFNSFGAGSDLAFAGTGAASPTDPLAGANLGGRRRTRRGRKSRKSRKGGNYY
jgi:hypothetical protein